MTSWRILAAAGVIIVAVAAPALAQAPADTKAAQASSTTKTSWSDLPDRFQVDAGFFYVNLATKLTFQGTIGPADEVSFEKDLGVSDVASTYWLDTTLRLGRRHQFKLSYVSVTRDGDPRILTRDFIWNDEVYTAGLSASGSLGTNVLSAYYRLAVIKRDRFEIGPALGLGYLKLNARIAAQGSLTKPGGQIEAVSLDESGSLGVPTGDIGGFFNAWLSKRVVMRGDFLYIVVKPGEWEASVTDWRIGVDFYPWRHVGIGTQYKYNSFRYEQPVSEMNVSGEVKYKGLQVYASFLF